MTSRERVRRALRFDFPDRVPRSLWKLRGIEMFRRADLEGLLQAFPEDILIPNSVYGKGRKIRGERYKKGETGVDEWGCEWHAAEDGVAGEVKSPPLRDLSEIEKLRAPYEILEKANPGKITEICQNTDQFVLAWTSVRPFERMQFLLGTERLLMELFYQPRELFLLRETLHEFYKEELRFWGKTGVDGVLFMDDWGSQRSLLISPELWRKFFKPLYREYCDLIHASHKAAFFHSDGNIKAIYPDLIDVGVEAVNSQLFCMDIEELGRNYRGKITFYGEIDRQHVLPFGTTEDVRVAVKRVKDALGSPEGGVIAQCEFGLRDPVENIKAVFEAWT